MIRSRKTNTKTCIRMLCSFSSFSCSIVFVNIISLATQIIVFVYFKILSLRLLLNIYVETYETSSQRIKFYSVSYALVSFMFVTAVCVLILIKLLIS